MNPSPRFWLCLLVALYSTLSQFSVRLQRIPQLPEDTIMPTRAPPIARSVTSPMIGAQDAQVPPSLSRTRTTPNRTYFDKYRTPSRSVVGPQIGTSGTSSKENGERELRKMKSAGELRRGRDNASLLLRMTNVGHVSCIT